MIWRIKKYDWSREVTWSENKSSCFPADVVFPCHVSRHNALRCITPCFSFQSEIHISLGLRPRVTWIFWVGQILIFMFPSKLGNTCIVSHSWNRDPTILYHTVIQFIYIALLGENIKLKIICILCGGVQYFNIFLITIYSPCWIFRNIFFFCMSTFRTFVIIYANIQTCNSVLIMYLKIFFTLHSVLPCFSYVYFPSSHPSEKFHTSCRSWSLTRNWAQLHGFWSVSDHSSWHQRHQRNIRLHWL